MSVTINLAEAKLRLAARHPARTPGRRAHVGLDQLLAELKNLSRNVQLIGESVIRFTLRVEAAECQLRPGGLLTTQQAAARLGVKESFIRRLVMLGHLRSDGTSGPHGQHQFEISEVDAYRGRHATAKAENKVKTT